MSSKLLAKGGVGDFDKRICHKCKEGVLEVDLFEEKYVCSTPWCGYSKEFTAEETAAFEKMREKSEEEAEPSLEEQMEQAELLNDIDEEDDFEEDDFEDHYD